MRQFGLALPFNWTKVELKLDFAEASEGWDVSFNWTKVELKQVNGLFNGKKINLLIELR